MLTDFPEIHRDANSPVDREVRHDCRPLHPNACSTIPGRAAGGASVVAACLLVVARRASAIGIPG